MNEYEVRYLDCVSSKAKNLQKINTIEIFYYVNTSDEFVIKYDFHSADFDLWKELVEIHKENCKSCRIFQGELEIGEFKIENVLDYYSFELRSKDFNLYRNINLIPYLTNNKGWENT